MRGKTPKTTPQERFARILKQGSSIPEISHFREQCRDVFRLGGVFGLYEWIEARRELGLLEHCKHVERAADDLQACLGSVIDAAIIKPKPKPRLDSEERLRLINLRETRSRNSIRPVGYRVKPSMQSRMMAGFDHLLDREIKEVQASRGG